jgi:hypothetical protein
MCERHTVNFALAAAAAAGAWQQFLQQFLDPVILTLVAD